MIEQSSSTTTDRVEIKEVVLGPSTKTISKCFCLLCSLLFATSGILTVLFMTYWIRDFEKKVQVISSVVTNGVLFVLFFVFSIYSFLSILCICINEENFVACNAPLYEFIKRFGPCKKVTRVVRFKPRERDTNSASTLPIEDVPEIQTDPSSIVYVQVSECKTIQADVHAENLFNLKVPTTSVDGKSRRPLSFPYVIAQDRTVSVLTPMPAFTTTGVSKSAPGSLKEFSPYILDYPIEEFETEVLPGGRSSSGILVPIKTSMTSISSKTERGRSAEQVGHSERQVPEILRQNSEDCSRQIDKAINEPQNQVTDDQKSEIIYSMAKKDQQGEPISISPADNAVKDFQSCVQSEEVHVQDLGHGPSVLVLSSDLSGPRKETICEQHVQMYAEGVSQSIKMDDAPRSAEAIINQGGFSSPDETLKQINEEKIEQAVSIVSKTEEGPDDETKNF